ncbi:Hypothetical predicted protein [Lecanosticta acicola]|uniref:Uncharacterized protein n=1 Tax=Lecanosticta acicola TaxID=111012 RepID=A0AAI9E9U4_9PEZI|nr:Hypothetical predicted protein [Lecanosticta acicola]
MDDYEIQLGVDWGTWKCAISYALSHRGERVGSVSPVLMSGMAHEVPMMATWHDGKFVHGFALEALADKIPDVGDKIITLFKLPLYRDEETSDITATVQDILSDLPGDKTLDMLIAEHLRAVVGEAKEAICQSEELMKFNKDELHQLLKRARVRVTVPQMWTLDARRRMQIAAKNAGLNLVTLASEPKCALAYLVDKIAQQKIPLNRRLGKGSLWMVADLGSGTGDFVVYTLLDTLSIDSHLRPVGHASGDLCGSSKVDELLWHTLVKREGGDQWADECAERLQISTRDFERRSRRAIERAKSKLCDRGYYVETVQGVGRRHVAISFTK